MRIATKGQARKVLARSIKAAEEVTKLDATLKDAGYHGLHIELVTEVIPVLARILEEAGIAAREAGVLPKEV